MINGDIKKNNEKLSNLFDDDFINGKLLENNNSINIPKQLSSLFDENNNVNVKNEGYLYNCTNSDFLTVNIYQGIEVANFEINLRNIGKKAWAKDSKLLVDLSSECKTNDVILKPQKPDEERVYKI